ncbi:Bulb-type lectin domain-containing protein [Psidium guajava]|nr:Bulb-type lectin domain-containing protein [Psidium guajava]
MGGVCSGRVILDNEKPGTKIAVVSAKVNSVMGLLTTRVSSPMTMAIILHGKSATRNNQKSSSSGRAGILSIKRAVKVLDALESGNWNFNVSKGLIMGTSSRGCEISILAFEVANTIVKGTNLLHSLSEKELQLLKEEILTSAGVQNLVSTNTQELLTIAAADKRLNSDNPRCRLSQEAAETSMQQLSSLAQQTLELYHALNALDRFERDYQTKLQEAESYDLPLTVIVYFYFTFCILSVKHVQPQ